MRLCALAGGLLSAHAMCVRSPGAHILRRVATTRVTSGASASLAKPGSLCEISYSLSDAATGEPLPAEVDMFDQGNVRLVVGAGGFLPALHEKVQLLEAIGTEQSFSLTPAACFGEPNPDMGPITVPATQAPDGLSPGDRVRLSNGLKARVTAVDDAGVTIDANHPCAGKSYTLRATLTAEPQVASEVLQEAIFAAGCFWGLELAYQRLPGVVTTAVGYTQGEADKPTYEAVCSGGTGHTEAVRVAYDAAVVSYGELLDLFWERLGESRYLLNQVGNDRGTQYRHGLYPLDDEQMRLATQSLEAARSAADGKTVHTEIESATKFWVAEDYHQQYLQKGGQSAKKQAADTIRCYG